VINIGVFELALYWWQYSYFMEHYSNVSILSNFNISSFLCSFSGPHSLCLPRFQRRCPLSLELTPGASGIRACSSSHTFCRRNGKHQTFTSPQIRPLADIAHQNDFIYCTVLLYLNSVEPTAMPKYTCLWFNDSSKNLCASLRQRFTKDDDVLSVSGRRSS